MGLFGGNYMKEGPGVDKNAPKKKGFFLFWDIIIRKFTKMLGVNILHFVMSNSISCVRIHSPSGL